MHKRFFNYLFIAVTLFSAISTSQLISEEADYLFYGRHLVVSFKECDFTALNNANELRAAFMKALQASGATCLGTCDYEFQPNGYTMIALLSESHASIHTYPEFGSCFIDVFTCGTKCKNEDFIAVLANYLKPGKIEQSNIERK